MFYLLLIFVILFTFLAIKRLEFSVQLLIFALPAYLIRFNIGPLPSNILEVMIWVVFLVWFFANFSELKANVIESFKRLSGRSADGRIKIDYPFGTELILLVVIGFVAAGVAGFSNAGLGIWKAYFFEPALLYIVVINVFTSPVILSGTQRSEESIIDGQTYHRSFAGAQDDKIKYILWPLCFSALAVSLVAVYQKLTGDLIDNPYWAAAATRRAVSFFGYPNAVGLYLGPLILLFIGWLGYARLVCRAPKKFQVVIASSIALSFIAIVFAKSSGALLGVSAGLAVFCLLANRRARLAIISIAALAAIGCAAIPLARHSVADKILLRDFSGTVRRIGWNDTWQMLSDGRLVFGAGLANFQAAVRPYHQRGFYISDGTPDFWQRLPADAALRARAWQPLEIYLYPHNIFLNFWSELGFAGLLLFIWIIGKYLFVSVQNLKSKIKNQDGQQYYLTLGLMAAMVVVVIHGLVDVPYFKNDLAVMFWLLIAMLAFIDLRNKEVKQSL